MTKEKASPADAKDEPEDGFHLKEVEDVEAFKKGLREGGPFFNLKVRPHKEPPPEPDEDSR